MFSGKAKSLPVVTYHYVNNGSVRLNTPPAHFEAHCRVLAENGWRGVGLDEAETFLLHGESLPRKSVLLTFDDGYLDNYVYAWPILRKYGHKGVIFPAAGFVSEAQKNAEGKGTGLRPTLKDVWEGRALTEELPPVDTIHHTTGPGFTVAKNLFFTWDEARAMEESGIIGMGGHGLFHDGVFASSVYDGFSRPGNRLNPYGGYPVRGDFWGRPNFERVALLTGKAFLPDEAMLAKLRAKAPQSDDEAVAFFNDEANIRMLEDIVASFGDMPGRMETDAEQQERITRNMKEAQAVLTKELGHPVRSFCWPWGAYSPLALEAGKEAGFSVFYTIRKGPNPPGRPHAVLRMDSRKDPKIMLSRIKTSARPVWGALYEKIRVLGKKSWWKENFRRA